MSAAGRALALVSGGRDGLLAAWLARIEGVQVECVHFHTGFVRSDRARVVARWAERKPTDFPLLHVIDIREAYLREAVLAPRFGYGSGMNPCIDCRILMLRRAAVLAEERGADLLITGEVVGQRAMDQSHRALRTIETEAGVEGRVLRPLSRAFLDEPIPDSERGSARYEGRCRGRGRAEQARLARELGLDLGASPSSGCCRLADPRYAARVRDHMEHEGDGAVQVEDLDWLDRGRHFRLGWDLKVIVGRDEAECAWMRENRRGRWGVQLVGNRGSLGVVEGSLAEERFADVASLVVRYGPTRPGERAEVILEKDGVRRSVLVPPATTDRVEAWRL